MVVFGGGSVAHCNNELHVLDLLSLEWSVPDSEGPVPPPRAGESGRVHVCVRESVCGVCTEGGARFLYV
jgi:hypothetical protein